VARLRLSLDKLGMTAFALVLVALLTLGGAPRAAAADETLMILSGAVAPALYEVLAIVAEHAGFYKAEHLNVVDQLANSPSVAAQLVATGKGDICSISYEAVLQGYERGLHLQYFMTKTPRFSNVLAVLDDSPIRTLADFKGANIGEISVGSAGEVASVLMLEGAGLHKNDVTYSAIGVGPQALDALVHKRVDAIAFPYGEVVPMEVVGNLKMRVFRDPVLKDVPNTGYAATPQTIQTKADALKRFTRAIAMAAVFVRENPDVAARWFLETAGGPFGDADVRKKAYEFRLLQDDLPGTDITNTRIGYLSPPAMQRYAIALAQYGLTSQAVPVSAVVTNQFIAYANDFDRAAVVRLAKNWPEDAAGARPTP
jgi:NitT/TauT family transport system substrate-binding protein